MILIKSHIELLLKLLIDSTDRLIALVFWMLTFSEVHPYSITLTGKCEKSHILLSYSPFTSLPFTYVIFTVHNIYLLQYDRGRVGTTWKRRKWVYGMLGLKGKRRRPILHLVKKRLRRYLTPIITWHVQQGTTIISDQWRAYVDALGNHGFTHFTINHSRFFADPSTGAHTQNIEWAWCHTNLTFGDCESTEVRLALKGILM